MLPAGRIPPNPSEHLGSPEKERTLETLQEQFEYVIIDAPPVLAVTDAEVLEKLSTGLLMLVATGLTVKQELEESLQTLDTAGTNVLGIVATMTPSKGTGRDNYGEYDYGAQAADERVSEEQEMASKS